MYLSRTNLTLGSDFVYHLTHYNPWLLSNLPHKDVNISKTSGIIKLQILRYIRNLLDSLKTKSLNHWISVSLEETDRWLYKATNGVPVNHNELGVFCYSWVFAEYICTLVGSDNNTSTKVCKFPFVYELLIKELDILRKTHKVPNNPIINGYIYI